MQFYCSPIAEWKQHGFVWTEKRSLHAFGFVPTTLKRTMSTFEIVPNRKALNMRFSNVRETKL